MAGVAFVHRSIFQADPIMLAQEIVARNRSDVVIADLIGIFRRRREIGRKWNLMAAELRCVDDVEFFLGRKRNQLFLLHKITTRFHGLLISRQNLVIRRMTFLNPSGGGFDALAGSQLFGEGFKFLLRPDEEALPQREETLRVVIEKVLLLQKQIEVRFADGVDAVAAWEQIALEKRGELDERALRRGDRCMQRGGIF